jgi:hypothetical protein
MNVNLVLKNGCFKKITYLIPLITDYSILENLCLACYWCNNAKTNYFSFEEFKLIGVQLI